MELLLFCALLLSVTGHRLTVKENVKLQKTCGQTLLVNSTKPESDEHSLLKSARSMNTNMSSRNEAPFAVMIRLSFKDGSPKQRLSYSEPYCSGTIISPRHILTAAHCIAQIGYATCHDNNHTLEEFLPTYGEDDTLFKLNYIIITAPTRCNKPTKCDSKLKTIIAEPKRAFVSKKFLNHNCKLPVNGNIHGDVAVIELKEDITFSDTVQPACIQPNAGYGIPLVIYGYGVIEEDNYYSAGILRKHVSYKIKKQVCRKYRVPDPQPDIPEEQTLFQFPNGSFRLLVDDICTSSNKSMACDGDSGSGLVFKKRNKTSVAAVTSFGPDCFTGKKYPHGYVDVSASLFPHLTWIWAATGINFELWRNYSEEDIERYMEDAYTFELHPNFDVEVAKPSQGQKATRMMFPK